MDIILKGCRIFSTAHKVFQFRIYPTKEQVRFIHQLIGCSCFVFNYFLAKWQEAYRKTKKGLTYPTCSRLLTPSPIR